MPNTTIGIAPDYNTARVHFRNVLASLHSYDPTDAVMRNWEHYTGKVHEAFEMNDGTGKREACKKAIESCILVLENYKQRASRDVQNSLREALDDLKQALKAVDVGWIKPVVVTLDLVLDEIRSASDSNLNIKIDQAKIALVELRIRDALDLLSDAASLMSAHSRTHQKADKLLKSAYKRVEAKAD